MAATAKKVAAPKAPAKAEAKEGKSVINGLDIVVRNLAENIEKQVKEVGGDVARGMGEQAVSLLRQAEDLLYRAEKEDR